MLMQCSWCRLELNVNALNSARESPVAWEGEPAEGGDNSQASQRGGPESNSSPAPKRWEAEEEAKEDKPPPEDEGSTSGVGDQARQEVIYIF